MIRKDIPLWVKAAARQVVFRKYGGACPCCERIRIINGQGDPVPGIEYDHWASRGKVGPEDIWPVCEDCNIELGEPGSLKRKGRESEFAMYQKRRKLLNLSKAEAEQSEKQPFLDYPE